MTERRIIITAGQVSLQAVLNNTPTADAVWKALPIKARGNRWGDEIYFGIPVHLDSANDGDIIQEVVAEGDLGYWPPGHAFCIFWGPTPASMGAEIRPASPVHIFGHIIDDAKAFGAVRSGAAVRIEQAED